MMGKRSPKTAAAAAAAGGGGGGGGGAALLASSSAIGKEERFDDVEEAIFLCPIVVVVVVVAKFVIEQRGRRGQQAVRTRTRECGHATVEKVARRTRNRRERDVFQCAIVVVVVVERRIEIHRRFVERDRKRRNRFGGE